MEVNSFFLQIHSWNFFGNAKRKHEYLSGMLSELQFNILLMQEAGTEDTGFQVKSKFSIGNDEYECIVSEPDPFARIERCTTSIAVEKNFKKKYVVSAGFQMLTDSRPVCYVDLVWGIRVATFHATALSKVSVSEVRQIMRWLDDYQTGDYQPRPWVLMGDFNSCPERYPQNGTNSLEYNKENLIQYDGNLDRIQSYCNIIADSEPTQGSNGERERYLDFAFTSYKHESTFRTNYILNRKVVDENDSYVSDHNLITLGLEI